MGYILSYKVIKGEANILLFHSSSPGVLYLGKLTHTSKFSMVCSFIVENTMDWVPPSHKM